MAHLTARDVDAALTDERVREASVIQLALMGGVLVFAGVIVFLAVTSDAAPGDAGPVNLLCGVVGLVFLSGLGAAFAVFPLMLSPARLGAGDEGDAASLAARALDRYRAANIVRLAVLEGAALFGLVAALLAVQAGLLPQQPLYALTGLPALVMVVVGAVTLPTRERIVATVAARLGG